MPEALDAKFHAMIIAASQSALLRRPWQLTDPRTDMAPGWRRRSRQRPTSARQHALRHLEGLPALAWQIADERGMAITIHAERDCVLDNPNDHGSLAKLCAWYLRVQVVFAHAGRAFRMGEAKERLVPLRGLPNLWLDAAAACESGPLSAIIEVFGPFMIVWGRSDFPVCQQGGRYVALDDGFVLVSPRDARPVSGPPACAATLRAVESLRAIEQACEETSLARAGRHDPPSSANPATPVWLASASSTRSRKRFVRSPPSSCSSGVPVGHCDLPYPRAHRAGRRTVRRGSRRGVRRDRRSSLAAQRGAGAEGPRGSQRAQEAAVAMRRRTLIGR
jgi:hypothetical protein